MTSTLKLVAIGNSVGIVFPKELLARLRVEKGDTLAVNETPSGIELRAGDAEFEGQMAVARQVMKDYRPALRELAK